jgi:serine/threonine-protein kinase
VNLAEAIEPGTVLVGKYRIESVLGRGGMGMVYRAHHLALDETIAIKVLRRDVSLDEETVHRFVREAQSAVKLKSEHVARIRDVGTFEDGLPYMVMEYLEGADLGQLIDSNGAMNPQVAVDLVLQACDAIAEAHSLGIVHRDIKPTNLFVSFRPDETAIVKVLDFGISKSASGADLSLTQTSSMLGTPAYMSPEQMRSARSVDARTDVWSIGTVLYELVEARRPFNAESFSEMCVMVAVDPPTPMQLAPELESIILRCLAKHPDQRYANVPDLMRELAVFAGNPEAARHFVTRAYRVLGLPVPLSLDSNPGLRPIVTYQTPVPQLRLSSLVLPAATARPTMIGSPPGSTLATPTIPNAPRNRRSTAAIVVVLCMMLGIGGAVGYVKATEGDEVTVVDPTGSAAAVTGSAEEGSAKEGSAAQGSAATGAAATEPAVGSGSSAGSDAGSAVAGAGSAGADSDADADADAGSGSATGSGAGSARVRRGSATVARGKPPKGGGKPPKGGGKPPKGGGDAGKGTGTAKGSTPPVKPKCDPFNSVRDGC